MTATRTPPAPPRPGDRPSRGGLAGRRGPGRGPTAGADRTILLATVVTGLGLILTTLPLFWSLPTAVLSGTAAAAGIALINSLGNLAGFVSPYLVGWLKDATQSTNTGMYVLAASLLLGGLLTLAVPAKLVNCMPFPAAKFW